MPMTTNPYPNIRARAERLLAYAFGAGQVAQIAAMLNPRSDQSPNKLVARLQTLLLEEGITVSVDRDQIERLFQDESPDTSDDAINKFVDDHYGDEFGAAQDELGDSIANLISLERQGE